MQEQIKEVTEDLAQLESEIEQAVASLDGLITMKARIAEQIQDCRLQVDWSRRDAKVVLLMDYRDVREALALFQDLMKKKDQEIVQSEFALGKLKRQKQLLKVLLKECEDEVSQMGRLYEFRTSPC